MKRRRSGPILAIASAGGHWSELMRLAPVFAGLPVVFATTSADYRRQVAGHCFRVVPDVSRWSKFRLIWSAVCILWLILSLRPRTIITTGAAPGLLAIRIGRLMGCRTIWLDSIANVEELSMSGRLAGRYVDLWLTQWEHLATTNGPRFKGSVL